MHPTSHSLFAVIGRPKLAGFVEHWGVLLPNGLVAHCTPNRGEHVSTLAEFAAGEPVRLIREISFESHGATLARIAYALRTPLAYHAVENNCEVFAKRMTGEKPESSQTQLIVLGLALAALIALVVTA